MVTKTLPFYRDDWLKEITTPECGIRCLLTVLGMYGIPKTFLDMGCGHWGHLPRLAASLGIDSVGVDLRVEPDRSDRLSLIQHDLTNYLDLGRKFGLVISWEVGEHLPESAADQFADMLAFYTEDLLIFTAAVPGQGGDGHINCQPAEYWNEKLKARGMVYDPVDSERLYHAFMWAASACPWYSQNVQVFYTPAGYARREEQ